VKRTWRANSPLERPSGGPLGEPGERLVGVSVAETFFSYMAGRSRYGKTETAIGQFVHLARAGHGGLFLDPHADAIAEIKHYLTDEGVRERVVEINLADRGSEQRQPGWNLFSVEGLKPHEADDRVEATVDAFASALRWDERNTRALNLTTQAAQALMPQAPSSWMTRPSSSALARPSRRSFSPTQRASRSRPSPEGSFRFSPSVRTEPWRRWPPGSKYRGEQSTTSTAAPC